MERACVIYFAPVLFICCFFHNGNTFHCVQDGLETDLLCSCHMHICHNGKCQTHWSCWTQGCSFKSQKNLQVSCDKKRGECAEYYPSFGSFWLCIQQKRPWRVYRWKVQITLNIEKLYLHLFLITCGNTTTVPHLQSSKSWHDKAAPASNIPLETIPAAPVQNTLKRISVGD